MSSTGSGYSDPHPTWPWMFLGMDTYYLSGQPFQCFTTLTIKKKKKNLPFIQSKFTLFWFKTVSLVLSQALKTNWKVCSVAYQMQYNLKWNQPGNSPFGSVEQCICICFTRSVQVWNKKTWTAYRAEVSAVTASIIYPVTSLSNANITGDWSCLVLRSFSSVV